MTSVGYLSKFRRWYPLLHEGVLAKESVDAKGIVVCHQLEHRTFAYYRDPVEFYNEMKRYPLEERCFYEVVMGDRFQKPYFDIDVDAVDPGMERSLLETLTKAVLQDTRIRPEDVLIFTSNGDDKSSYHVVINRWVVPNSYSNKVYCGRIIDRLRDHPGVRWIDRLVYKNVQQFRALGSTKYMKDRYKRPLGEEYDYTPDRFLFYRSLVSNSAGCRLFESCEKPKPVYDTIQFTQRAYDQLKQMPEIIDGTFSIDAMKDGLVTLIRNNPSYCRSCDRIHENENPFVTLANGDTILFHCRRGKPVPFRRRYVNPFERLFK